VPSLHDPDAAPGGHPTGTPGLAGQGVGIMVDAVNKVVQLGDDDIAPPPSFGAGVRSSFISGMARLDGEFAVVLDIDRILTMQDTTAITTAISTRDLEL
jgi:purine-binding chemotaxis protein CheW